MTKSKEAQVANALNAQELFEKLDTLSKQRTTWEQGIFKQSNDELYAIIAKCLDYVQQIRNDPALRKQLNEALKLRKITFTSSTSLETRVVRWVFGECGARAYTYATVLSAANDEKIDPLKLPKWIRDKKGVEHIRRSNGKTPELSKVEYHDLALIELDQSDALGTIGSKIDDLSPNTKSGHAFSVALVRTSDDGTSEIVFATNAQPTVRSVLVNAGKQLHGTVNERLVVADLQETASNVQTAIVDAMKEIEQ